jgi:hypothetical protein
MKETEYRMIFNSFGMKAIMKMACCGYSTLNGEK